MQSVAHVVRGIFVTSEKNVQKVISREAKGHIKSVRMNSISILRRISRVPKNILCKRE